MTSSPVLDGEVAIVTGSGRNIGQDIAERFAAEGAAVVVADLDASNAQSTVDGIVADGNEAVAAEVDVTDERQVTEMVELAEDEFGPVDILVNCATTIDHETMFDTDMDEFDRVLAVNLRGPFLCTREAAKSMRDSGGGRVVNFASTSAHVARPEGMAYGMAKKGLLSFTKSAANGLAEHDIRVNAISPTRTGSAVGDDEPRTDDPDPDLLRGRWGEPADQTNTALFLVSDDSDFITGSEIVVDGGALASTYNR